MTIMAIENAFTKEQCDHIISLGSNNWEKGFTSIDNEQTLKLEALRKSDIFWINDKDITNGVLSIFKAANNKAQWNFNIEILEDMQLARYGKGEYYDWHADGNGVVAPQLQPGMVRKISMSILLNDDYEGGELEFMHTEPLPSTAGTAILFPSYTVHRVKPVRKGTRYSLVGWFGGPKFV